MTAAYPHPDGLARARALQGSGDCCFCEEPIRQGIGGWARVTCGEPDCLEAYRRSLKRDLLAIRKTGVASPPRRRPLVQIQAHLEQTVLLEMRTEARRQGRSLSQLARTAFAIYRRSTLNQEKA